MHGVNFRSGRNMFRKYTGVIEYSSLNINQQGINLYSFLF